MSALLAVVERAAKTNLLLAEDYLARNPVGDQGGPEAGAPPAAGGALYGPRFNPKRSKASPHGSARAGPSRFPIDCRMRRCRGLAHDELGRKDRPLVLGRRRPSMLDLLH